MHRLWYILCSYCVRWCICCMMGGRCCRCYRCGWGNIRPGRSINNCHHNSRTNPYRICMYWANRYIIHMATRIDYIYTVRICNSHGGIPTHTNLSNNQYYYHPAVVETVTHNISYSCSVWQNTNSIQNCNANIYGYTPVWYGYGYRYSMDIVLGSDSCKGRVLLVGRIGKLFVIGMLCMVVSIAGRYWLITGGSRYLGRLLGMMIG